MSVAGGADAIVVAAGASTRMDGTDKLLGGPRRSATAGARGRCAGGRPRVEPSWSSPRRNDGEALVAGGRGCDRADRRSSTGGGRRQDSVDRGSTRWSGRPDPAGERVVLVHDGARPRRRRTLIADVVEPGTARCRDPGPVRRRDAQAGRRWPRHRPPSIGPAMAVAQTPQGALRRVFRDALATPGGRERHMDRRGRTAGGL